ncbi:MAG: peptidase T [Lachnospiraceae bacterium]|nr:peptidase T [Lachnospiraceae bacterium]
MRAYERLLKYTQYPTASDEKSESCPSTPAQLDFAEALVAEMKELGIEEVTLDENGYVYGTIPSNIPDWEGEVIGFIAHMDVVDVVPWENIRPRVVENFDGCDILLNEEKQIVLSPRDYPELLNYVGKSLVVTDGTTLLGADDKAGIADILTMAEYLQDHPEVKHGTLKIGFTPDEEIGRGADHFDVAFFGADYAYTVDGGAFGEVEYETFNAASAIIEVTGRSIHPGGAKNKMINAARIAAELDGLLPEAMRPEHTEGREGFFHLAGISGSEESAKMFYILRDHDAAKLERQKEIMQGVVSFLNVKYGEGIVALTIRDSYRNMAEQIKPHMHLVDIAHEEVKALGGTPVSIPVRGGTDGSRLSFMGLPCPNLGTGGHNCHGRFEYACIEEMDLTVQLLTRIAMRYAVREKA